MLGGAGGGEVCEHLTKFIAATEAGRPKRKYSSSGQSHNPADKYARDHNHEGAYYGDSINPDAGRDAEADDDGFLIDGGVGGEVGKFVYENYEENQDADDAGGGQRE